MATPSPRSIATLTWLACVSYTAPACAQTVWIVDQANGPGTHFTSVAPAISAAAGGDHVRIRAGSYVENALDVDKSLSIVGEPGVSITLNVLGSAGLTIHDLPASAPFAMRGLRIGGQLAGPPILVRDCAGLIVLEDLEGPLGFGGLPEGLGLRIERCDQVHLHELHVRGGQTVTLTDSVGVITDCTLESGIAGMMLTTASVVTLDGTVIDFAPTVGFAAPLRVDGGELSLTRSTIAAPTSTATPLPAIEVLAPAIIHQDPTAVLVPGPAQPAVSGPATVVTGELHTLTRHGQGVIDFDLHGRTGNVYVSIATLPAPSTNLPFGRLWIDLDPAVQLPIGAGVFTTRQQTIQLDVTPLPPGVMFVVQTGALDASMALHVSNGVGNVTF